MAAAFCARRQDLPLGVEDEKRGGVIA